MKKPKKEKRGGPRNAVPSLSLRLYLPSPDVLTITGHADGYRLAREALSAVAFSIRNPDLPPQA